jgi:hypothetical protein
MLSSLSSSSHPECWSLALHCPQSLTSGARPSASMAVKSSPEVKKGQGGSFLALHWSLLGYFTLLENKRGM